MNHTTVRSHLYKIGISTLFLSTPMHPSDFKNIGATFSLFSAFFAAPPLISTVLSSGCKYIAQKPKQLDILAISFPFAILPTGAMCATTAPPVPLIYPAVATAAAGGILTYITFKKDKQSADSLESPSSKNNAGAFLIKGLATLSVTMSLGIAAARYYLSTKM